jgi:hypothetical protein
MALGLHETSHPTAGGAEHGAPRDVVVHGTGALVAGSGVERARWRSGAGAPGGTRTHTERCLRAQPLPIGLRGRVVSVARNHTEGGV